MWIGHIQQSAYGHVFSDIKKNKKNDLIRQLQLFVDITGLLRCNARIENSNTLSEAAKFPLLLPRHALTSLVIRQAHVEQMHSGRLHTLARLRQIYWIPSERRTVKSEITQCAVCRRVRRVTSRGVSNRIQTMSFKF